MLFHVDKMNRIFLKKTSFIRIVFMMFMLFSFVPVTAQTKRALVIGLGQQEDKAWAKINGDRDVPLVVKMLRSAGFKNIDTLVDSKATKAGIVASFRKLESRCKKGDVVYIHFSGHGQQMTDCEGDESDGLDEAWIPYDAYKKYCAKDRGEKHLSDDEVGRMLMAIRRQVGPNGKILVVVDACHSGSATREPDADEGAVRGTWDNFIIPESRRKRVKTEAVVQDWLSISACKDYQNNYEMKDKKVGKLTCALFEMMQEGKNLSDRQIVDYLVSFMKKHRGALPQTPVFSGTDGNASISDILRLKK